MNEQEENTDNQRPGKTGNATLPEDTLPSQSETDFGPDVAKLINQIVTSTASYGWSGPMPPPAAARLYEEYYPGVVRKMYDLYEESERHRMREERSSRELLEETERHRMAEEQKQGKSNRELARRGNGSGGWPTLPRWRYHTTTPTC